MNRLLQGCLGIPLLLGALLVSGCAGSGDEAEFQPPEQAILFAQHDRPEDGEYVFMEAQVSGRLVVADGCLRFDPRVQGLMTPVWPDYLSLMAKDDELHIVRDGKSVIVLGEVFVMGGGLVSNDADIEGEVPGGCPAPYWVVGEIK